ncbi:MAG: SirB2 family protein [Mariprofundus sp.]|nr:SirB2 family protein [Mariprofundus sp.]
MLGWLLPLHISLVGLSLFLFIWRGVLAWQGKCMQRRLLQRFVPDSVDTLLLASGILLAYTLGFAPWQDFWLAAKLTAILFYIGLGFVAFGHGGSVRLRHFSFIFALLAVVYIVAVAHTMHASPWVSL